MNEISQIGLRLKELRESSNYTLEDLAAQLNLDPAVYAGYEQNGCDIPISVIYEIANKFKVDFAEIVTGTPARLHSYHVVRRGHGKNSNRNPEYHFEDLAYRYSGKIMQPLLVTLDPADTAPTPICHLGQEFNLVLEGTVILNYDGETLTLNAGDSIYFNAAKPHGQHCGSTTKARFLTVIAE